MGSQTDANMPPKAAPRSQRSRRSQQPHIISSDLGEDERITNDKIVKERSAFTNDSRSTDELARSHSLSGKKQLQNFGDKESNGLKASRGSVRLQEITYIEFYHRQKM